MYFPKSWSVVVFLAVNVFAMILFLAVYIQGGVSHAFLATH